MLLNSYRFSDGGAVDPYAAYVKALLRMDGANNSQVFADEKGRVWTPHGATDGLPCITTSVSPSAGNFPVVTDYLTAANDVLFAFGAQPWCVECWVRSTGLPTNGFRVFDSSTTVSGNGAFVFLIDSQGCPVVYAYNHSYAALANSSGQPKVFSNVWSHVAAQSDGTHVRVFVDGIEPTTYDQQPNISAWASMATAGGLGIGVYQADAAGFPSGACGLVDDWRVTVGAVRYTGNFTPPPRGSI